MPFESHPELPVPTDPEAPIWRYFEFDKFDDLMRSGQLYFRRADCFKDQREGHPSPAYAEALAADPSLVALREHGLTMQEIVRRRLLSQRGECYLNCWTWNATESRRMWDEYVPSKRGVILCSTFSRLARSFDVTDERVFISTVTYDDILPSAVGFQSIIRKDDCHRPDAELRAFVWRSENMTINFNDSSLPLATLPPHVPSCWRVTVSLHDMVTNVVMAPHSTSEDTAAVVRLLADVGCPVPVRCSSIV